MIMSCWRISGTLVPRPAISKLKDYDDYHCNGDEYSSITVAES
jgi:hypothetical protein